MVNRFIAVAMAAAFVLTLEVSRAEAKKHKRPGNVKALVHHIVHSLASGDVNKFLLLAPTHAEVTRYCPGMKRGQKMVAKLHQKLGRGFDRCAKLLNWKHARVISFTGGQKKKRPVPQCTGVWELKDIDVKLRVGGRTVALHIDDPFVLNGTSFGVTDNLGCGGTTAKPPARKTVPYKSVP